MGKKGAGAAPPAQFLLPPAPGPQVGWSWAPHCPAMASALTVLLLGCWLAGQSWAWGQGLYPKPSISASPGGVIPVGGNVTIRCWTQRLDMRFLLYKDGDGNYLTYTDPAGSAAEFPIVSAGREDGGNYTCLYANRTGRAAYSELSDPVQIIVADPSLPRPSASLSPTGVIAPGADVTIRCQGPGGDVRFFVHQAGELTRPRPMDPAGDGAEFHVCPVGRQHGGSYSCSYRPQAEPFVSSPPSDPVGLVVAEGTDPTWPRAMPAPICPINKRPATSPAWHWAPGSCSPWG
ncbi:T-cell-interacting, activating receptor on myeloid cells protein 1-like isoform X3 [Pelodiscus sinensis]|uniref:T-cell-interacting, activating receptor on myeloid cells protein 1-like isoform X3 n=1 Tax=Pelodiscus sinensis TaxID=13735 RepID=UPI003F6C1D77